MIKKIKKIKINIILKDKIKKIKIKIFKNPMLKVFLI
jgi:hypothetical protein